MNNITGVKVTLEERLHGGENVWRVKENVDFGKWVSSFGCANGKHLTLYDVITKWETQYSIKTGLGSIYLNYEMSSDKETHSGSFAKFRELCEKLEELGYAVSSKPELLHINAKHVNDLLVMNDPVKNEVISMSRDIEVVNIEVSYAQGGDAHMSADEIIERVKRNPLGHKAVPDLMATSNEGISSVTLQFDVKVNV